MDFKSGQDVYYEGKKTFIEELYGDGTARIKNPGWNWDEEAASVEMEEEYEEVFWLTVNITELTPAN